MYVKRLVCSSMCCSPPASSSFPCSWNVSFCFFNHVIQAPSSHMFLLVCFLSIFFLLFCGFGCPTRILVMLANSLPREPHLKSSPALFKLISWLRPHPLGSCSFFLGFALIFLPTSDFFPSHFCCSSLHCTSRSTSKSVFLWEDDANRSDQKDDFIFGLGVQPELTRKVRGPGFNT